MEECLWSRLSGRTQSGFEARWSGAGVGVGMLRGRGGSWLLRFLVSQFLGFLVLRFLVIGCLVSWFHSCLVAWLRMVFVGFVVSVRRFGVS